MFSNISHLYKISLSPNISIPIISLETRSDCMNEAQKSTTYRKRSVLVFLHFPGGELTQSDSPAPPPPWHLSTLARFSELDFTGMVGLDEVGASGELAYCAGFLSADSAAELQEGRELKVPEGVRTRCPPRLTG